MAIIIEDPKIQEGGNYHDGDIALFVSPTGETVLTAYTSFTSDGMQMTQVIITPTPYNIVYTRRYTTAAEGNTEALGEPTYFDQFLEEPARTGFGNIATFLYTVRSLGKEATALFQTTRQQILCNLFIQSLFCADIHDLDIASLVARELLKPQPNVSFETADDVARMILRSIRKDPFGHAGDEIGKALAKLYDMKLEDEKLQTSIFSEPVSALIRAHETMRQVLMSWSIEQTIQ